MLREVMTPEQVAEVLSLKTAYVHELCRAGRIPATKSGKYWMIPAAGLRRWLAYQNCDIDGGTQLSVQSLKPRGNARPRAHPAGRDELRWLEPGDRWPGRSSRADTRLTRLTLLVQPGKGREG